jgi:hypothetical protein
MKRSLLLSFLAVLSCPSFVVAGAGPFVEVDVFYDVSRPQNPSSDYEGQEDSVGPVSASVADPLDKANASGTANYGLLGVVAEMDPDVAGAYFDISAETTFRDLLTITGTNSGATAIAYIRLNVKGEVRQPFVVTEVTGYVYAEAQMFASSSIAGDDANHTYTASGLGSPVINSFDDVVELTVPFIVGDMISLRADLNAYAQAYGLSVDPSEIKFSALFGNTAELLPIRLQGISNPVIMAESGATYAFVVPEPNSIALLCSLMLAVSSRFRD